MSRITPAIGLSLLAGALLAGALPTTARAQSSLDLGDAWPRFYGIEEFEGAGTALTTWDANGDGYADVVMGSPGCSFFAFQGGCVGVFLGGPDPQPATRDLLDADMLIYGSFDGENAGLSLDASGDINGDGRLDLLVGSPQYSGFRTQAGRVAAFFGQEAGTPLPSSVSMGTADLVVYGDGTRSRFGFALSVGDLDGDGAEDMVIGARRYITTRFGSGGIQIIYGQPGLSGIYDLGLGGEFVLIEGETFSDNAGRDVAVGDFNGDGFADWLASAPLWDGDQGVSAGRIYLWLGGEERLQGTLRIENADMILEGDHAQAQLGWSLTDLGDLDGDGRDDFAVAAYGQNTDELATGRVMVFFGRDLFPSSGLASAEADLLFDGEAPADYAGHDVERAGDVDGDGRPDFLIGSYGSSAAFPQAGRSYLIYGRASQAAVDWPASLDEADLIIDGGGPALLSGYTVSGAGDVDADGVGELLIGAPALDSGIDPSLSGAGGAFLVHLDDLDGDGVLPPDDCGEGDPTTFPGADEVAYDGIDQDCDGSDLTDVDGDGVDAVEAGGTDCDDLDAAVNPAADEITCDGIDQDCDGADLIDADGDGFASVPCGGSDCDDEDAAIGPSAEEIANLIDDDCDGAVDEDTDLADDDGDGFCEGLDVDGDGEDDCAGGADPGDCDDFSVNVFPGAPEAINSIDDNCDGMVDEGTSVSDDDGDGWPEFAGDCDDDDPNVHPGATEIPGNDIDEDCDGRTDETVATYPEDSDGDGYCEGLSFCSDGSQPGDCDDTDPLISPDAEETPYDGIDQDCDGADQTDVDGDGEDAIEAGGTDCDDFNPSVNRSRADVPDGLDNDCDGEVDNGGIAAGGCGNCSSAGGQTPRSNALLGLSLLLGLTAWRRKR